MHRLARFIAVGGATAALLVGAAGTAAASTGSPIVGHVYVNNNSAGRNTVSAFDRHANGTLSPIPGTPFNAGGAGIGAPTGSAGALQLADAGRFVVAVDAASDQLSVLKVRPNGALQLVDTTWSHGREPVSLAVHRHLVYVANEGVGGSGSNYTGFRLNDDGKLTHINGSTFPLPVDALPGQVLFSGDGHSLIGTRVGPSAGPSFIDSFVVRRDGRLAAAPGSPFPAQKIGPFGSEFRPTNPNQLFVSNAHDGAGLGSVSVYHVADNGNLSPVAGSPYADLQTAPCWVAISHDGKRLFAVNTGSQSISGYRIAGNGALSLVGSTALSGVGLTAFDAALDPTDAFLYVVDAGTATISVLAVHGGSLTELSSSPIAIPGGGAPFGIVVD